MVAVLKGVIKTAQLTVNHNHTDRLGIELRRSRSARTVSGASQVSSLRRFFLPPATRATLPKC